MNERPTDTDPVNSDERSDVERSDVERSDVEATDPPDDSPPAPPSDPPHAPPAGSNPARGGAALDEGLVRDPYAKLGGIASGLAHRYGWSVPLVRLGFVVALLGSFGLALVMYLVAWVVIPRATMWPPTTVRRDGRGLRGRDLGIGLAVLGALVFLAAGDAGQASILVPLALVAGGVWLLVQDERTTDLPPPVAETRMSGEQGDPAGAASFAAQPPPVARPVAPRSRRRTWIVRGLIGAVVVVLLAAVAVPIAFLAATDGDGFNLSFETGRFQVARYAPTSIDELPERISSGDGFVSVDLGGIPPREFSSLDSPFALDIVMDSGDVSVEIPDDVEFSLVAETDTGSIETSGLDSIEDDTGPDREVVENSDADVVITITTADGDIDIDVTK